MDTDVEDPEPSSSDCLIGNTRRLGSVLPRSGSAEREIAPTLSLLLGGSSEREVALTELQEIKQYSGLTGMLKSGRELKGADCCDERQERTGEMY